MGELEMKINQSALRKEKGNSEPTSRWDTFCFENGSRWNPIAKSKR